MDCPRSKEDNEYTTSVPYLNAVRSIMYAIVYTRPGIDEAVSVVSRYMENSRKTH